MDIQDLLRLFMGYLACEECSEADIQAVGPSGSTLIYILVKEENGGTPCRKNRILPMMQCAKSSKNS